MREVLSAPLWEEGELFGEGYLTKKAAKVIAQVVEPAPIPKPAEKGEDTEYHFPRPMQMRDAPPRWRCNARKQHCPDGVAYWNNIEKASTILPCMCEECMIEKYPYLEIGESYIVREENREELEQDFVGLYVPSDSTEYTLLCSVCSKPIDVDEKSAERFNEEEETATHVTCLSTTEVEILNAGAGGRYQATYIVRKRQST